MRQIILSMMISIDGYVEGVESDISWHVWNYEMQAYMMDFLETVDTFIYGRKSYELMLEYWSDKEGKFADIINNTPKIVFSKTLKKARMHASISDDVLGTMRKEKTKEGKNMVLFAGASLASSFMANDLIDEFRLIVNPVALGRGVSLFQIEKRHQYNLVNTKTFLCSNVLLIYKPK